MPLSEININRLVQEASKAMLNAYAPYSGFTVGAAILTKSGTIISGCNIENISFTPTVCAERVAIFKAISEGIYDFIAIAIVSSDGKPIAPCGVCRQVLGEFAEGDIEILMHSDESMVRTTLDEILPYRFKPSNPIGKRDIWKQIKDIILEDSEISDDELELVKNIMNNLSQFESIMTKALEDGEIDDQERLLIEQFRERIYDSAYNSAMNDGIITDEEEKLIQKLVDILSDI